MTKLTHTANRQHVRFEFLGYLVDLLQCPQCKGVVDYEFTGNPSVKDSVEACGIPHTEVDQIVIDGHGVDLNTRLRDGQEIAVGPKNVALSASPTIHLCTAPVEPIRFILDVHLGKLARRLRMLGFDCRYRNDFHDDEIARLACSESRVVLTRDRGLLKRSNVAQGLLIRYQQPRQQLVQVVRRYQLISRCQPGQRCSLCNALLVPVSKDQIRRRLKPRTVQYYDHFLLCPECDQVYWRGAHFKNIERWVSELETRCKVEPNK